MKIKFSVFSLFFFFAILAILLCVSSASSLKQKYRSLPTTEVEKAFINRNRVPTKSCCTGTGTSGGEEIIYNTYIINNSSRFEDVGTNSTALYNGSFAILTPGQLPPYGNPATFTFGSEDLADLTFSGSALVWYRSKAALLAGIKKLNYDQIGLGSTSFGALGNSSGQLSMIWGYDCEAGDLATAWGDRSQAQGFASTAWGSGVAKYDGATAWGVNSLAYSNYSTAWGVESTAGGIASTAWGEGQTDGDYSTAWGYSRTLGKYSTAFGEGSTNGDYATAWGSSLAKGIFSTSWGTSYTYGNYSTGWGQGQTPGNYATAWGRAVSYGNYSTGWGNSTSAYSDYSTAWGTTSSAGGIGSTAWGRGTTAADYATAFGLSNAFGTYSTSWNSGFASASFSTAWNSGSSNGQYSTAFGLATTKGTYSTAWGRGYSFGDYSTAWGQSNTPGNYATAWGRTNALSDYSTAWGADSVANATYSTVAGTGLTANVVASTVVGSCNLPQLTDNVFEVGTGVYLPASRNCLSRSTGLLLTSEGDLYISGNIYTNTNGNPYTSENKTEGCFGTTCSQKRREFISESDILAVVEQLDSQNEQRIMELNEEVHHLRSQRLDDLKTLEQQREALNNLSIERKRDSDKIEKLTELVSKMSKRMENLMSSWQR